MLFCNLLVSLISSILNIIACPLVSTDKYITILNASNAFCAIFHCSCWSILSGLRYLFIIHKSWILLKFPNFTSLGLIAILAVFLLFFSCLGVNLLVFIGNGWPNVRVPDMPRWKMLISGGLMFGTYFCLISFSCIFYSLILHARTKMSNEVSPELRKETTNENSPESSHGNVLHEIVTTSLAKEAQNNNLSRVSSCCKDFLKV